MIKLVEAVAERQKSEEDERKAVEEFYKPSSNHNGGSSGHGNEKQGEVLSFSNLINEDEDDDAANELFMRDDGGDGFYPIAEDANDEISSPDIKK